MNPSEDNTINILVGNSADPSNNHFEIIEKLESFKNENINIFCPLSYGDLQYARQVIAIGEEKIGDKFLPLTEFMPLEDYLYFLAGIDIAIFNHKRQQGMGNIITLLGMGKKVYMELCTTSFKHLDEMGIKVFSIEDFDLSIDFPEKNKNIEKIKSEYSEKQLVQNLYTLFSK